MCVSSILNSISLRHTTFTKTFHLWKYIPNPMTCFLSTFDFSNCLVYYVSLCSLKMIYFLHINNLSNPKIRN